MWTHQKRIHKIIYNKCESRDSSVSMSTGYWLGGQGSIPGRGSFFPTQTGSGPYLASNQVGTGGSFPGGKVEREWSWLFTSIWCRGKEWWSYTSRSAYVLMPWCLTNVMTKSTIFCDVTPCIPVEVQWRFGGTHCMPSSEPEGVTQTTNKKQLASRWRLDLVLPKRIRISTSTLRPIPEGNTFHRRCRENVKSNWCNDVNQGQLNYIYTQRN
jgi:hypothetical protein